jgi:hypothetical protein
MIQRAFALAVASGVVVALGVGLIYPPAGVITAGVEGLCAAYLFAYFGAKGGRAQP